MIFRKEGNALTASRSGETLRIEGWGKDALRVSAVMNDTVMPSQYALTETPEPAACTIRIGEEDEYKVDGRTATYEIAQLFLENRLTEVQIEALPD